MAGLSRFPVLPLAVVPPLVSAERLVFCGSPRIPPRAKAGLSAQNLGLNSPSALSQISGHLSLTSSPFLAEYRLVGLCLLRLARAALVWALSLISDAFPSRGSRFDQ